MWWLLWLICCLCILYQILWNLDIKQYLVLEYKWSWKKFHLLVLDWNLGIEFLNLIAIYCIDFHYIWVSAFLYYYEYNMDQYISDSKMFVLYHMMTLIDVFEPWINKLFGWHHLLQTMHSRCYYSFLQFDWMFACIVLLFFHENWLCNNFHSSKHGKLCCISPQISGSKHHSECVLDEKRRWDYFTFLQKIEVHQWHKCPWLWHCFMYMTMGFQMSCLTLTPLNEQSSWLCLEVLVISSCIIIDM